MPDLLSVQITPGNFRSETRRFGHLTQIALII